MECPFEGGSVKHIFYSGSSGELNPEITNCEWIELRMISPGGGEEVIDRVNGPPADYMELLIGGHKRLPQVAPGHYGFKLVGGKGTDRGESSVIYREFRDQLSGELQFDETLSNQELGSSTVLAGNTVRLGWYNLEITGFVEPSGDPTRVFTVQWNFGIGAGSFILSESTLESQLQVIGAGDEQGSCDILGSSCSSLSISKLRTVSLTKLQAESLSIAASAQPTLVDCEVTGRLSVTTSGETSIRNCRMPAGSFTNNNEVEIQSSEFQDLTVEICSQLNLTDTVAFVLSCNHLENLSMTGCAIQRDAALRILDNCQIGSSDFLEGASLWLRNTSPNISGSAFMDTLSMEFPAGTKIPDAMPITGNGFFGRQAIRIDVELGSIPLSKGLHLPDNYWGGPDGPSGSYFNGRAPGWLDTYGGTYANFPKGSKAYRSSGIYNVSGLVSDEPFPDIWVDDYRAGQHTLSKASENGLAVRSGREMMVCYDVRSNVPLLSGLQFWVEINGNTQRRIYPYSKSCQTIQRAYAKSKSVGLARTVNFVIPEERVIDGEMYITLHCDGSGVSGYSTEGPRETQIFHGLRFTPWKPREEPLRIGITDTMNSLPGYKTFVDRTSGASALKALLEEEIPKMLPIRKDELEIVILPRYRYGKSFTTFVGSLFNRVLKTVSWSMHRELEQYLEQTNKSRTDKIHYLIGVVPDDALGKGTSGETIGGSKVARVREDRHWSALHEFLHMIHLYEKEAEQYDLPSGRDIHGNTIEHGSGAMVMGTTAFVPGDAGPASSDNHHYPEGRFLGKYDIMGVSPHKWPVPSTLHAAFAGLGLTPPSRTPSGASAAPIKQLSSTGSEIPAPGTRRVLFTGIAERAPDDITFRLIPGSIQCRDVTGVMQEPITPGGPAFDARLIQYEVVPLVLQEVWLRQPAANTGTIVLWQQTFDIPDGCTGYQIRDGSTNANLFTQWDSGEDPVNSLSCISNGEVISEATSLHATVNGDPVQSQLYWRSGNDPWLPLGEVFSADTDIPLSDLGLPTGSDLSLMLLSSDGFRRTQKVIAPLNIPNRPPEAAITEPASGTWMPQHAEWTLRARATDAEDGSLASGDWISSIDGALGSGTHLSRVVLSPGRHQITFTARDSGSASADDSIEVAVVEEGSVDLHIAESHLNWFRPADDDYSLFPNTPRIGTANRLDVRIPAPAETDPFRAQLILERPGSDAEVVVDKLLDADEGGFRSLSYTFVPDTRGTYRVTVSVEPPEGSTDLDLSDNSFTWIFENQAPVCNPSMVYCIPNQMIDLPLEATDPEGDAFVFEIVKQPDHGVLSGNPPNLIYTAPGSAVEDSMQIRASDGLAASEPVTITFRVADPPAAPVLATGADFNIAAGALLHTRLAFYFGTSTVELKSALPTGLSFDAQTGILSGTLEDPGEVSLNLWAYNGAGVTANQLNIHTTESFLHWISQQGLPPGRTGPGDDPDGDGIPNLNEFAYGLNAGIPNHEGIPYFQVHDGELDFIFRRRPGGDGGYNPNPYTVDGIRYHLEMSTSLQPESWYAASGSFSFMGFVEDTDPLIETIRLRLLDLAYLDSSDCLFFRLRVTTE